MFRPSSRFLLIGAALLATAGGAAAADYERGRQLYDNHCTACHESQVHIRKQRKVGNMAELLQQIQRWQHELDLPWTATEIEDVRYYLNQRFYRFSGD